jgi:hypothetical protein
MDRHWTEDDFIARIYGVGPRDGHLETCPQCRDSWLLFQSRREFLMSAVEQDVPARILASQRQVVLHRIKAAQSPLRPLVPILAAAGTLALGVFLMLPPSTPSSATNGAATEKDLSDAQLFQETAAIGQSAEPRGAKPIEALFQE